MLKHVSATTLTRRRGPSPAPSSASISTLESSGSSASSTCSSPSASSSGHLSEGSGSDSSNSSAFSSPSSTSCGTTAWRSLAECRTYSRLSVTEHPNAMKDSWEKSVLKSGPVGMSYILRNSHLYLIPKVPLRVYAAALRSDIQYKTIGVSGSTTCEEVIGALLTKCKVRFKDPRLFQLSMEVEIRCPDGCNTRASIKLEDRAIPLHLQECYPRGQARFILNIRQGALVKIFDESNTVGWQYKSVLISEKTTATELLDILFRFTSKGVEDLHFYALHLEVNERRRPLTWNESVIAARDAASRTLSGPNEQVRIILKSQILFPSSNANFLRSSTLSLYDNVTMPPNSNFAITSSTPVSQMETSTLNRFQAKLRRQRSKSFSESSPSSPNSSLSADSFRVLEGSRVLQSSPFNHPTLTESVLASLTKFGTSNRYGKYDLSVSEAFFV